MFKRIFLSLIPVFFALSCHNIELVSQSRSSYQVVLPKEGKDKNLNKMLEKTAQLLQGCIKKSTGTLLPILSEDKMDKSRPGIFIGNTEVAKKAGINLPEFKEWEYVIRGSGKNVILAGGDFKVLPSARQYNQYSLGTVKAVIVFLEKYCGTSFMLPGPNGIIVKKKPSLSIPEKLDIRETPRIKYCTGRSRGIFYDIANDFYPSVNYGSYGGHSHNMAIPPEKYYKTHPEYFALIKGKRYNHSVRPQYCISNPDVRELIYKELLRKLDQGYEYAQLAQSDGFKKCECDECAKLFGVKDFGEKLWIMHRDMAQRLMKDRPGKKVVILAYGPTKTPPETFKEFPENVSVELCSYSPEFFEKWKDCKVPGGFTVYIYNWGYYRKEGFTPKVTPEFCQKQLKLFLKNNIWGIYRCGFGELFGLEGPTYYLYGKLLADPSLNQEDLINEYCETAFGAAAEPMKKFYQLLNKRLEIEIGNEDAVDWNDGNLLDGKTPQLNDNIKILTLRYPAGIVAELEACLNEAAKKADSEGEKIRIELAFKEFNYLKKTARVAELFDKHRNKPSLKLFQELLDALEERDKYVEAIPADSNGRVLAFKGIPLFGGSEKSILSKGGSLRSDYKAPFYWDTKLLRRMNVSPGARSIKAPMSAEPIKVDGSGDEAVWQKAEPDTLLRLYMNKNVKFVETTVQVAYDKEAFYALFKFPESSSYKLDKNSFMVFLEPDESKEKLYRFGLRTYSRNASVYQRFPSGKANYTDVYKPAKIKEKITCAFKVDQKSGAVSGEIRIPFSIYNSTPVSGSIWHGNFTRRIPNDKRYTDFIWEPNINWRTWRNRYDVMGKIIFE